MNPIPGRVQNNHIRLILDAVQHLQHITGDKFTVIQTVLSCISLCCLRSHKLRNRAGAAVKVENHTALQRSHILSGCFVQYLRAVRVCLEKGKGGNFKFQSKQFFVKIILSIQDIRSVALHHIRFGIIDNMQNPRVPSLQPALFLQFQQCIQKSLQKLCFFCRFLVRKLSLSCFHRDSLFFLCALSCFS